MVALDRLRSGYWVHTARPANPISLRPWKQFGLRPSRPALPPPASRDCYMCRSERKKKTIRGVGGLHGLREHRVGPVAPACTWDVSSLESASTWDRTFSHSFFLSFQFVFYFSRFYFLFLLSCSTLSISLFLFFSFFSSVNISSRTSMYIFFVLFFSRVVFLPYYFIFILPFFSFLMLFFFHVKLSIHDVYFSSFLYFFFVDFIFSIFYLILFTCIFFI